MKKLFSIALVLVMLLGCALPILVGVAVYVVAAVKLKAITRQDCLLLPKGVFPFLIQLHYLSYGIPLFQLALKLH